MMMVMDISRPHIPARRRIGCTDYTFIYDGGILMDVMTLISGITQAVGAYRAAVQTLDEAKIATATNEITAQLAHLGAEVIALQEKSLQATERERALLGKNHGLADRIRELEETASEKGRYELVEDYPGTITYRVKEAARNGEPAHYLCPGCLDNRSVKSILQFNYGKKIVGVCHECSKTFRFANDEPIRTHRSSGGYSGSWMGS
jgi:hypothetical protein